MIYMICDGETKEPRYVGFTDTDLDIRMKRHWMKAKGPHQCYKSPLHKWMAERSKAGVEPEIIPLDEEGGKQDELWYIKMLSRHGVRLLNREDQVKRPDIWRP